MGFSRQGYWSGLPCPPPGDLPNSGIKPMSLLSAAMAGGFFTTSATRETQAYIYRNIMLRKDPSGDLHGGLMVKTSHSQCRGNGFNLWSGNQDPACQVAQPKNQNPSYLLNQEQTWPMLRKLQTAESPGQKSCCWYLPLPPIPQRSQGGAIFDPASPESPFPGFSPLLPSTTHLSKA